MRAIATINSTSVTPRILRSDCVCGYSQLLIVAVYQFGFLLCLQRTVFRPASHWMLIIAWEPAAFCDCMVASRSTARFTLNVACPDFTARNVSVKTLPFPETPGVEGGREAVIWMLPPLVSSR